MNKIMIVIKFDDGVVIPDGVDTNYPNIFLGDDFYEAQRLYEQLPTGSVSDLTTFVWYYKNIFTAFFATRQLPLPALVCLYCLADKLAYLTNSPLDAPNFLTYFAFEYELKRETFRDDLDDLAALVMQNPIAHWWYENPLTLCADVHSEVTDRCLNSNDYYNQLGFQSFPYRGEGVTIIDSEDYGSTPQHTYLPSMTVKLLNEQTDATTISNDHFYKTLGVLFAVSPTHRQTSQPELHGIVPQASLGILAFPYARTVNVVIAEFLDKFWANFTTRTVIPATLKAGQQRISVLLFERQATLQIEHGNDDSYFSFPLEVFPDMRKAMIACWEKGIIVIQPAGQQGNASSIPNLDTALRRLKRASRHSATYTDFSKPFLPHSDYTGSASIMVGALDKTSHIKAQANYGTIIDVYLWGECIESLGSDGHFLPYDFTSAASAIAAGIVGALQSAAMASNKVLTTPQIKSVFNKTFRGGRTAGYQGVPFNSTSVPLQELWEQCAQQLGSISPSSH